MTGLANLVRLHRWILDEKRQTLVELEQLADRFKGELAVLEESLEAEKVEASRTLDGALAFQTFVAPALERRRVMRETVANLDREADAARDVVGEAFQELKKYETAQDQQKKRDDERRRRTAQLTLDELGVGLYRRGRAAGEG